MFQFGARKEKRKKVTPSFEYFVSPLMIEDCVWRIQNFPGKGGWFPVRSRITVTEVDDITWEFRVQRSHYFDESRMLDEKYVLAFRRILQSNTPYLDLEISGSFIYLPTHQTFVTGSATIKKKTFVVNGIAVAVFLSFYLLVGVIPLMRTYPPVAILCLITMIPASTYFLLVQVREFANRCTERLIQDVKGVLER